VKRRKLKNIFLFLKSRNRVIKKIYFSIILKLKNQEIKKSGNREIGKSGNQEIEKSRKYIFHNFEIKKSRNQENIFFIILKLKNQEIKKIYFS